MVNRYPITCAYCRCTVPAQGGDIWKRDGHWYGAHLECKRADAPRVNVIRIGDREFIQNKRGRCEDAPCCGCCTY